MPKVYEAKADGTNSLWYKHHSLIRFYLDIAHDYSSQAKAEHQEGMMCTSSIIGILFSAMSLEAFCNEMAEGVFSEDELDDFHFCKRKFKKKRNSSSVTTKLDCLFREEFDQALTKNLQSEVNAIFSLRNNLSHYKLTEMATIYEGPPAGNESTNPEGPMVIDFQAPVVKSRPALVERVTGDAAVKSYNSALGVINFWGSLMGIEDNTPNLGPIA